MTGYGVPPKGSANDVNAVSAKRANEIETRGRKGRAIWLDLEDNSVKGFIMDCLRLTQNGELATDVAHQITSSRSSREGISNGFFLSGLRKTWIDSDEQCEDFLSMNGAKKRLDRLPSRRMGTGLKHLENSNFAAAHSTRCGKSLSS